MSVPDIGTYGVLGGPDAFTKGRAAEIERAGYGAIWIGGSPSPDLAVIEAALAETERIVVGTGIVNVWSAPADGVAASYHRLEERYPGRLLLGIGAGHPEVDGEYQSPYQKVVTYLDELDTHGVPKERRVLAALRGKMLKLAAERTAGALPVHMPVEQTRFARGVLGAEPLLAVFNRAVFEPDAGKAHEVASERLTSYLGLANYVNAWKQFGFPALEVGAPAPSRLLEAVTLWGTPARIAEGLRAQLDAGADHVGVVAADPSDISGLAELAKELGLS